MDSTSRRRQVEVHFYPRCNKSPLSDFGRATHLERSGPKVHNNQDFAADEEERELRAQLARLLQEHRDLDAAIAALQDSPGADILQVQRLKKRKLYLRDRINAIEDQLTPDIIA